MERLIFLGVREVDYIARQEQIERRLLVELYDPVRALRLSRAITGVIDHRTRSLTITLDDAVVKAETRTRPSPVFDRWVTEQVTPHPEYGSEYSLIEAGPPGRECVCVFSAATAFLANGRMVENYTPRYATRIPLDF